MTKFIFESETEAFQWDNTDATFAKISASLPGGWAAVSSNGALLLYTVQGEKNRECPIAIYCPETWWVSLDRYNVQLLRPDNFSHGHYRRVEG